MRAFRVFAPAKINLVLRILERREDGYHDLDTLFQAISLGDEVTLVPTEGSGIDLHVEGADVGPIEDNLAFRAAREWAEATGIDPRVRIHLSKHVPAGAGLGGGSSDAGAVLRGLEAMYGAPLGPAEVARIGTTLGADVPFFCGEAGLARGEGIGERLTPLPGLPERNLVVAVPPVPVPTAGAYGWLAAARAATAAPESTIASPGTSGDSPGGEISRLADLSATPTWEDMDRMASNDFHQVVADRIPEVARVIEGLEGAGLTGVMLSGSGSAVFGYLPRGNGLEGRGLEGDGLEDGGYSGDGPTGDAGRVDLATVTSRVRAALPGVRLFAATTLPTIPDPEPMDLDSVDPALRVRRGSG